MARTIQVQEQSIIRSLDDIVALRENNPWSGQMDLAATTLTGVGQNLVSILYWSSIGSFPIQACFMPHIKSWNIMANRDIKLGIRIDNANPYDFRGPDDFSVTPNSFTRVNFILDLKANVRHVERDFKFTRIGWNSPFSLVNLGYDVADSTQLTLDINFHGQSITKNTDLTAPYVVQGIGDSLMFGTGATEIEASSYVLVGSEYVYPQEPFMQQVRKYLYRLGYRFWLTNKAQSSSTTSSIVHGIKWGYYDLDRTDLIICMIGANDANNLGSTGGLSVTANQTKFSNNIDYILNWKQKRYPSAKMLMLGSTPSSDNTTETRIEIGRQIMAARVAAINDSKIKYKSLANAFDRTVQANYLGGNGTDTIHTVKQKEVADLINAELTSLGWYV